VPDIVVLHYTAMPDVDSACRVLCSPAAEVSAHYLIGEDGQVLNLVPEEMRAWHAGSGSWGEVTDVNSHSIGIELANTGFAPFSAPLMDALEELLAGILTRWNIPAHRVIAHSDLAPGRKIDPGMRFDWQRLARGGLAVVAEPGIGADPDPDAFVQAARAFGYTSDVPFEVLLGAVRLRHRAGGEGPLDSRDMGIVSDLANRFGVDAPGRSS